MASDVRVSLEEMFVYPVKSCAGVAVRDGMLIETGLEFDHAWMLVGADRHGVTERDLPRLALVRPLLRTYDMVLRAPGMLALHIALDTVEAPLRVTLGGDDIAAYDIGDLAAHWFTKFLGRDLRLVRFDPQQRRLWRPSRLPDSDRAGGVEEVEIAFTDTAPLHVASTAVLGEVNRRLAAHGSDPATLAQFRPNLVLGGLDGHAEDDLVEIVFDADDGPVRLKLVGDRVEPKAGGAPPTCGMFAVVVDGIERTLRVGMTGRASRRSGAGDGMLPGSAEAAACGG